MSSSAQSLLLAAALNSREFCEQIDSVKLTDDGAGLLRAIRTLYEGSSVPSLSRDVVATVVRAQCHDDKVADNRVEYLHDLPQDTDATAKTLLHAIRLKEQRLALIDALLRDTPPEDLPEQLANYAMMMGGDPDAEIEIGLESLIANTADKIKISPAILNDILNGGVRPGQTVFIYGRPGSAKTLHCVEMVAGFAKRGKKCYYIGNEEGGNIILLRFISRMSSKRLEELDHADSAIAAQHIREGHAMARKHGLDNVKIIEGVTHFGDVLKLVHDDKPDVIVLDQLRHMSTGEGEGMTQNMESSMRALRMLCNKHGIIGIGVGQAGASAQDKLVLGLNDLDNSKTGLQGACDLIIGVGVNAEWEQQHKRMLSICRNKISGKIWHGAVFIDEQRTKVLPSQ